MGEIRSVSGTIITYNHLQARVRKTGIFYFKEYLGFIQMIGEAICGKKIRDEKVCKSDNVNVLLSILDQLSKWIDEIQPLEQQQRFGNKAFRDWYEKLTTVRIS